MAKIIIGGLRFFQLLFSVVVLGLSITLIRGQTRYKEITKEGVPATTNYSAFTGAFGILAALVGITSIFIESLNGIVTWALDALAALLLLAGGIAMTIGLKGVTCSKTGTLWENPILNCGTYIFEKRKYATCGTNDLKGDETVSDKKMSGLLTDRCGRARADEIFMFLGFALCVATLAFSFFRRGKTGSADSYI